MRTPRFFQAQALAGAKGPYRGTNGQSHECHDQQRRAKPKPLARLSFWLQIFHFLLLPNDEDVNQCALMWQPSLLFVSGTYRAECAALRHPG
jgi:hypothetical protein